MCILRGSRLRAPFLTPGDPFCNVYGSMQPTMKVATNRTPWLGGRSRMKWLINQRALKKQSTVFTRVEQRR